VLGLEPSRASLEALREQMGLNRPLYVQYVEWLWRAAQGDLGSRSARATGPSPSLIFPALWRTLELAGIGVVIGLLVSIPLGILAARRAGTWVDQLTRLFALVGLQPPELLARHSADARLLVPLEPIPGRRLRRPERGPRPAPAAPRPPVDHRRRGDGGGPDPLHALGHARGPAPRLRPDRPRQGAAPAIVVYRHALRNAMIPFITVVGINFGALIGGMVVTEQVFAWPGLGWLIIQSITVRSYAVVQGAVLITAALFVTINLVVDLLYAFIDPRVSYG
jgi:peptide/nickel transport system permease protein